VRGWQVLLAGLLLLVLGGCGMRDIDNRFFVVTMGIDAVEGKRGWVEVTLKMAIPKAQLKYGSSDFVLQTAEGPSVGEAINIIEALLDKKPDFGHMKMAIFGERLAKEGLLPYIDWLQRSQNIQKICWMAIGKPSPKEVLSFVPKSERMPSHFLYLNFTDSGKEVAMIAVEHLFSFYREVLEEGIDPVLPLVEVTPKGMRIESTMMFHDDKLVFRLDRNETKLFNVMKGQIPKRVLQIEMEERTEYQTLNLIIDQASSSFDIQESAEPKIGVNIELQGKIEEMIPYQQVTDPVRRDLEKMTDKTVKQKAEELLNKLRKAGIDPIGFGLKYRSRHFGSTEEEMKKWQELYKDITFDVKPRTKINSSGNLR
jgi:spore germination protein KC